MDNKLNDIRIIRILLWNFCVKSWKQIFQIFLNIFIWKQTEDIRLIAIFNLVYLSVHTLTFALFSPIVKRWYRNLLHFTSLIWFAGVFLWIMYLSESAVDHLVWVGASIGFFNSIYWVTYHNTQFDITSYRNRWNYEWIRKAGRMLISIIIPVLVWFMISLNYMWYGYESAFFFWSMLFILGAFVGMVNLDIDNDERFDLIWVTKQCISNKDVFRSLYTYTLSAFSFSNSVVEIIIPIIIFSYVQEEFDLWIIVSVFSIVSIFAMYLFWKFVHYKSYKKAVFWLWSGYGFAMIGFVLLGEIQYLIIFSALLTSIAALYALPQKVISDNVLHQLKNYKNIRSEYMVIREVFMYVGWSASFVILYIINSVEKDKVWYLFLIMVVAVFISAYQLSKVDISKER